MGYLDQRYRRESERGNSESSGGNYHFSLSYRIDRRFFRTVQTAVIANRITPTEAFDIIGVGYKGYKVLSGKEAQ
jgi:hypothetical protein